MRKNDVFAFIKSVSSYMKSGLNVQDALNCTAESGENGKIRSVSALCLSGINSGDTFSESLEKAEIREIAKFIPFIDSSERAGKLSDSLAYITEYADRKRKDEDSVRMALVYPVFILVIMAAVVFIVSFYVFPKIEAVLNTVAASSSGHIVSPVRSIRAIGKFLYVLVLLLIAAVFIYRKNRKFRFLADRIQYKLPFVKKLRINRDTADMCFLMSMLLSGGLGISGALEMCADSSANMFFASSVRKARLFVTGGGKISDGLKDAGIFPEFLISGIRNAEVSGGLEEKLLTFSRVFAEKSEMYREIMTRALEPALTLVVGLMVFAVVMKFVVPLFEVLGEI